MSADHAAAPAADPAAPAALSPDGPLLRALSWALAGWMAWVFMSYLHYKWGGNPGSVFLFETLSEALGLPFEPYMRYIVGGQELLAAMLVLIPATRIFGAALGVGTMAGAICFHLFTKLGVDPYGDGGQLFTEACLTLAAGLLLLLIHRREVADVLEWGRRTAASLRA